MLPIVAVQISPAEAAPELEARLLDACSHALARARCVSARGTHEEARAIAMVSWSGAERVSIEVGLGSAGGPAWVSRELSFGAADPELERWRAVGFTIALLVDDDRFWPSIASVAEADLGSAAQEPSTLAQSEALPSLELRTLAGSGVVAGPWRLGGELRFALPVGSALFVTSSVNYALAERGEVALRWLDVTLGGGVQAPLLLGDLAARLRLELVAENLAAATEREGQSARRSVWVPGLAVGGDVLWPLGERGLLSARVDLFWLDGATPIAIAGDRLATSAGAGVLLGLGAGYRF